MRFQKQPFANGIQNSVGPIGLRCVASSVQTPKATESITNHFRRTGAHRVHGRSHHPVRNCRQTPHLKYRPRCWRYEQRDSGGFPNDLRRQQRAGQRRNEGDGELPLPHPETQLIEPLPGEQPTSIPASTKVLNIGNDLLHWDVTVRSIPREVRLLHPKKSPPESSIVLAALEGIEALQATTPHGPQSYRPTSTRRSFVLAPIIRRGNASCS